MRLVDKRGRQLVSKCQFAPYMAPLKSAHRDDNLVGVMCRALISVDWEGYVYDCDFNQMLTPACASAEFIGQLDLVELLFDGLTQLDIIDVTQDEG